MKGSISANLERQTSRVARWLAIGSGVTLLGVMLLGVADAAMRYVLSRPIPGAVELSQLLLAVLILCALPHATATDQHVVVDSLTTRLHAGVQRWIRFGGATALFVVLALVSWQMSVLLLEFWRESRTTLSARLPVAPFLAVGLLGMCVATLVSLSRAVTTAWRD